MEDWKNGILEYWKSAILSEIGTLSHYSNTPSFRFSLFHRSTIPLFHFYFT
jgi:hypothetical protein